MAYHVVEHGQHLDEIAYRRRVTSEAIWRDERNATLRQARPDPNQLCAGDVVYIPDPPPRAPLRGTAGTKNVFTAAVPRVPVRVALRDAEGPLANQSVTAFDPSGGQEQTLTTDGEGVVAVEHRVTGPELELLLVATGERLRARVGGLDPSGEASGQAMRLRQLGYGAEGDDDEARRAALRRFQSERGLPDSGDLDTETSDALRDAFGC